jgi:hypothetical protein
MLLRAYPLSGVFEPKTSHAIGQSPQPNLDVACFPLMGVGMVNSHTFVHQP